MAPEQVVFVIIALTLGAQMLGMPRVFSPFAAGLFGVLLTFGYNWSSLDSVERGTELVVAGFSYGATAVGTHKSVDTVREVLGRWGTSDDAE